MLYRLLKPLLFALPPEAAHRVSLAGLRALGAVGGLRLVGAAPLRDPRLCQTLWGRTFANPLGLAAGMDKDARHIRPMAGLGFGFLEVGTVTPRPQAGNPRPRLLRHAEQRSLQNAMGFNNAGLEAVASRLRASRPHPVPIGVNLGKNRATPLERAGEDYERLLVGLGDLCDYLVINVSSPNTPGLRELQTPGAVAELLDTARRLTASPVLVKLSPDLPAPAARELAVAALDAGAAGLVVANTTTDYGLLPGCRPFGGLSGEVLRERSFRMLETVAAAVGGGAVLVSVGGVDSGAEVYRRLKAGARLVQLYTALVFQGPGLVRKILEELLELFERDGVRRLEELVGADRRPVV